MVFSYVIRDYFTWHYLSAWKEIFTVWLNFLWFTIHFFSIPQLFHSLFAPWKRITEERKQGFRFEDIASYIVINLLSRLIGAFLRIIILGVGLCSLTVVIIIGVLTYICWLIAPLIIITSFVFGVSMLVSYFTI
jgi:hypothetical protein